jgi:hypothetical protein
VTWRRSSVSTQNSVVGGDPNNWSPSPTGWPRSAPPPRPSMTSEPDSDQDESDSGQDGQGGVLAEDENAKNHDARDRNPGHLRGLDARYA